jgi:hypothetical protein
MMTGVGSGGLWYSGVALWLAAPGAENRTHTAFRHAMATFKVNPQWQAKQDAASSANSQAGMAASQAAGANSRAMQAAFEHNRTVHQQIYEGQQHPDLQQKWGQVINGTQTVVESSTGTKYEVESGYNHYYVKGDTLVGTDSEKSLGNSFTPLDSVPW